MYRVSSIFLVLRRQYDLPIYTILQLVWFSWWRRWHMCYAISWYNLIPFATIADGNVTALETYSFLLFICSHSIFALRIFSKASAETSGVVYIIGLSMKMCNLPVNEDVFQTCQSESSMYFNCDLCKSASSLEHKAIISFWRGFHIDRIEWLSIKLSILSIVELENEAIESHLNNTRLYGDVLDVRRACVLYA